MTTTLCQGQPRARNPSSRAQACNPRSRVQTTSVAISVCMRLRWLRPAAERLNRLRDFVSASWCPSIMVCRCTLAIHASIFLNTQSVPPRPQHSCHPQGGRICMQSQSRAQAPCVLERDWPKPAKFGGRVLADFGQTCPNLGKSWPASVKFGPSSASFGQTMTRVGPAECGQTEWNWWDQIWPNSAVPLACGDLLGHMGVGDPRGWIPSPLWSRQEASLSTP